MSPRDMTELAALALDLKLIDRHAGTYSVWISRNPQEIAFSPLTIPAHALLVLQSLPMDIQCNYLNVTGNKRSNRLLRRARIMGDPWPDARFAGKDVKWIITQCAARWQLKKSLEKTS